MHQSFKKITSNFSYTDYKSVFGTYKNKKYKIISERIKDTGRITVTAYLLTSNGYVKLFNENDLAVNTNDYYVKTGIEKYVDIVTERLNTRVNQAIKFIETVY